MSVLLAGGVVTGYFAAVVGIHRLNIARMRRAAGGFSALGRLDWDSLISGLLPSGEVNAKALPLTLSDGAPVPSRLAPLEDTPRARMLRQLIVGAPAEVSEAGAQEAGFSGGEARFVHTLSLVRHRPGQALAILLSMRCDSAAEVYLREHLFLAERVNFLNLELASFAVRKRLREAIARFGDSAPLYFARARSSALLGLNIRAIDDLARAVYFSEQSPFYVSAVLDTPYIAQARPPLAFQCRQRFQAGRAG